jgi:thioredoxin reductase (NADPH)
MQTTDVENWPGEYTIQGPNLIEKMKKQAQEKGAQFINDTIVSIDTSSWPYRVVTTSGLTLHALSIILATGSSPHKLGVEGESRYWGTGGVSSCAICDAWFFKEKKVVVVGGGDSAIEEAMILARHAQEVTILVRKQRMRAAATMQDKLRGYPNIHVIYNVVVKSIEGNGKEVTGVIIQSTLNNTVEKMAVDGIFLAVGHEPNTQVFRSVIPCDKNGYITVIGRSQETKVPGIFAAGDVEDYEYRQAIVASGSGVKASLDAQRFLTDLGYDAVSLQKINACLYKDFARDDEGAHNISEATTYDEWEKMKTESDVVIADFWAPHCVICKQIGPILDDIASSYPDIVKLVKINTDEAEDLAEKYVIRKLPTILVFYKGNQVGRYTGALTRQELVDIVNRYGSMK